LRRVILKKTIYDSITEAGHSFCIYFNDFPSALFCARLREPQYWACFGDMAAFYDDVAAGTLPDYSFLEPRWFTFYDWGASDQHPPHDVAMGEYLIADIYEALRAGPKWSSTLFIITYDEHGGFYDHVSPPQRNVPAPDDQRPPPGQPPFSFDRLGIRVPCIVVSPWIDKNTVIHEPQESHYSHTSILSTVKKLFDLPEFLTKRDAWSPSFESIVDTRSTMRQDTPVKLPRPGTLTDQEKWAKYGKRRVTPEDIEQGIRSGNASMAPLSDLQKDVLAVARGIADDGGVAGALTHSEEVTLETEHHGAIFVQRQVANFLKRLEALAKAPIGKDSEWIVI